MSHVDLPALDPGALERLQRFGGDTLLRRMIALYLEAAPERIGAARAADASREPRGVELALHSLKSSSAQLGAMHMQRLAERGEALAREGTLDGVTELLREMEGELGRVHEWLTTAAQGKSE